MTYEACLVIDFMHRKMSTSLGISRITKLPNLKMSAYNPEPGSECASAHNVYSSLPPEDIW